MKRVTVKMLKMKVMRVIVGAQKIKVMRMMVKTQKKKVMRMMVKTQMAEGRRTAVRSSEDRLLELFAPVSLSHRWEAHLDHSGRRLHRVKYLA